MEININITKRLDWLEKRIDMSYVEREYIELQMKGLAQEIVENLTIPVVSSCESSVQLFKLECLNEDGDIENNGYYKTREEAEKVKAEMDAWPGNTKYGIKQNVIEIETED